MASTSYSDVDDESSEPSSLHQMFKIVGDQIIQEDLRTLKLLTYGILRDDIVLRAKDGFTFFLALEKIGKVDQTNFNFLAEIISQHTDRHDLLHFLSLKKRKTVTTDPVSKYLEETCKRGCQRKRKNSDASLNAENVWSSSSGSCQDPTSSSSSSEDVHSRDNNPCSSCSSSLGSARDERRAKQSRRAGVETRAVTDKFCHSLQVHGKTQWNPSENQTEEKSGEIKKKMTCDIRLRVRAEYSQSEESLENSVHSDKEEALERQFERFTQANTILKSRDLGSIICDIKFSELTYLDAFWRDYVNGSLLEALKGVFITDSLKQAVGHETIKLMVNVDEDDYETGRLKLLQNLTD